MATLGKRYIDDEGVQRGYYVYLHKDRATGLVFYVGKGHGHRAWDAKGRNDRWQDHVSSLMHGWEVELVETDLSEIAAFHLEEKLVEKYGGSYFDGGTLTNAVSGGESALSVGLTFELGEDGCEPIDIGNSGDWPRTRQVDHAKGLQAFLEPIMAGVRSLVGDDSEANDEAEDLEIIVGSLLENGVTEFLRRRISWPDLCGAVEEMVEDLADLKPMDERVKKLQAVAHQEGTRFLQGIRSGRGDQSTL